MMGWAEVAGQWWGRVGLCRPLHTAMQLSQSYPRMCVGDVGDLSQKGQHGFVDESQTRWLAALPCQERENRSLGKDDGWRESCTMRHPRADQGRAEWDPFVFRKASQLQEL